MSTTTASQNVNGAEAKILAVMVEVFGLDDTAQLVPTAELFADLGAETVDLNDLVYQLSREFPEIKLEMGDLFFRLSDLDFEEKEEGGQYWQGKFTSIGVDAMRMKFPEFTVSQIGDMKIQRGAIVPTVGFVTERVLKILSGT